MADQALSFIRKDGRIIPIRKPQGAVEHAKTGAAHAINIANSAKHHIEGGLEHVGLSKQPVKVHAGLDALGAGLSFASGVVGIATFGGSAKKFAGGILASHAIDAVGIGANAASVAGKGNKKERAQQFARQEIRNQIIGWGTYGVGLLAMKANRTRIASATKKVVSVIRRTRLAAV